jgi:HAE1 family hydrophobic/amphiphilic exporter-1
VRPIFITTTTTVLGLLPLVVLPGAGSELYRGLGSVVLGGLLVSTFFTLVLVPTVFTVTMDARLAIGRWWAGATHATQDPAGPVEADMADEQSPQLQDA